MDSLNGERGGRATSKKKIKSKSKSKTKTLERHHLYTEDTVTVTGWPRMDAAASKEPSAQ